MIIPSKMLTLAAGLVLILATPARAARYPNNTGTALIGAVPGLASAPEIVTISFSIDCGGDATLQGRSPSQLTCGPSSDKRTLARTKPRRPRKP